MLAADSTHAVWLTLKPFSPAAYDLSSGEVLMGTLFANDGDFYNLLHRGPVWGQRKQKRADRWLVAMQRVFLALPPWLHGPDTLGPMRNNSKRASPTSRPQPGESAPLTGRLSVQADKLAKPPSRPRWYSQARCGRVLLSAPEPRVLRRICFDLVGPGSWPLSTDPKLQG